MDAAGCFNSLNLNCSSKETWREVFDYIFNWPSRGFIPMRVA